MKYELDETMLTKPYPARSSKEREIYRPGPKSKAKKRQSSTQIRWGKKSGHHLQKSPNRGRNGVIVGVPYKDSPRGHFRETNEAPFNSDPGDDRQLLYRHEYYALQVQYRPLNTTALEMLKTTVDDIKRFTPNDRKMYKMIAWQCIENLNYVSTKYAYKRINQENPNHKIKEMMKNYYH